MDLATGGQTAVAPPPAMRRRLTFGALITLRADDLAGDPASDLAGAVALAGRAEALGLEFVTVRSAGDGERSQAPDPWTVASWIAARTTRIGLVVQVAPGTHPTVQARAAASLDLLSGGRVTLALTTEGAVGRTREAAVVIRGVLDAAEPGPFAYHGDHYTVPGAQRGPLPPHRIPVWLTGAHDDADALRLAGDDADGWVGDRANSADRARDEAALDEAAEAAGRSPAEIRRVAVVEPSVTAAELLELLADGGTDTVLVAAGEASDLERFARRTIPAVRDALPEPTTSTLIVRPASVRAKRRPGIDYDTLPASLAATAVEPGDHDYARVRSTYARAGSPGLVLRPRTAAEVADALAVVRAHPHLPFSLRSGGHGFSGRSTNDGGIVVSLAALDGIEVLDARRRLVRIRPGARWMDVADALQPYGWALSSGDYGGVGVGGLATAGGIGWLARAHGLTIDHLRAADVVLADGTFVRASPNDDADLFWALRGAGANMGVATAFEFEVDEVGDVGFAQLAVGADDPADLLVRWGAAIEAAPRELTGQIILGRPRAGRPAIAQVMAVVDSDDPATIVAQLEPVAQAGPLYDANVVVTPYAAVIANGTDDYHQGRGEPVSRSALIGHLTPQVAAAAARLLASGAVYWFQIRSLGGAVADVPAGATAFGHRAANFSLVVMGAHEQRLDAAWAQMRPYTDGLYLSFETDRHPDRLTDAFPAATLARLRELKRRYDPHGMFRDNFPIDIPSPEPAPDPAPDPSAQPEDALR